MTPGGPPRQTLAALRCCPRYHHNEYSPILSNFEALSYGFTVRCLRLKTPFLVANQDSLPVDGQSFPDGLVPAGSLQWLSVARFRFPFLFVVLFSLSPPPSTVLNASDEREIPEKRIPVPQLSLLYRTLYNRDNCRMLFNKTVLLNYEINILHYFVALCRF